MTDKTTPADPEENPFESMIPEDEKGLEEGLTVLVIPVSPGDPENASETIRMEPGDEPEPIMESTTLAVGPDGLVARADTYEGDALRILALDEQANSGEATIPQLREGIQRIARQSRERKKKH